MADTHPSDTHAPGTQAAAEPAGLPTCLRITEDMTIPHATELHRLLCDWLGEGPPVLDLSAVRECDSAGVQLLFAAQRSAAELGQVLRLLESSHAVLDALRRYGLQDALLTEPALTERRDSETAT
jgi:anti-anti-sigma factor